MLYVYDTGYLSFEGNCVTWKIYNFFSLPLNVGCEIRSKLFVYGSSRYSLYIWPRGRKGSDSEEWFGICLYKYDLPGIGNSVQFSIVSSAAQTIKTCTAYCSENNLFRQERFMEWSDFQTLRRTIAPDGCLTVVCRLSLENQLCSYTESYDDSKICMHLVYEPPPKYNYHSPISLSLKTPFNTPEAKIEPFTGSKTNCNPLSTSNPPITTTYLANPSDFTHETDDSDLKKMCQSATGSFPKYPSRNSVRGLNTVYVKVKPEANVKVKPEAKVVPEKITSKSICNPPPDSENAPNDLNSPEDISSSAGLVNDENSGPSHPGNVTAPTGLKILSQQLKQLYLEGKNYDMTIMMEGREFKVLKSILMARSPVFVELFSKDSSEDTSNVITIDPFDACDSTVFHDFLLYIYSGEIENLPDKNIYGLYCAACKFETPDLKEECAKFLQSSLSIDTIAHIFRSENSNNSELMDLAIVFLAKNMELIMNTDGWKQFMRQEPERAIECQLKALKIGYTKTIE